MFHSLFQLKSQEILTLSFLTVSIIPKIFLILPSTFLLNLLLQCIIILLNSINSFHIYQYIFTKSDKGCMIMISYPVKTFFRIEDPFLSFFFCGLTSGNCSCDFSIQRNVNFIHYCCSKLVTSNQVIYYEDMLIELIN